MPLEGLRRNDADLNIKFLGSPVRYNHPVDDPLFSAHRPVTDFDLNIGNITRYVADSPLTGVGCTVQVCWSHAYSGQMTN
jgi:hypothetical protein